MSWLSNRFSAAFQAPEAPHGDGEQDDVRTSQGSGVTEDLSELTKSFTRQLWGVASLLAPPPSTRSSLEKVDPPSPSSPARHIQVGLQNDPCMPSGESSLLNELVDLDFHTSIEPAEDNTSDQSSSSGKLQALDGDQISSLSQSSDHGLTGIGKDLAELKGSVAIGFSRILKVVRDEIDRNEKGKQQVEDGDDENEDYDDLNDESESSVQPRKLPVFNSLLKPLLSSLIRNDGDKLWRTKTAEEGSDHDYEEYDDDSADVRGHHMSLPPKAPNLQHALSEGIGGISKFASILFPGSLDSDDEHDQAARGEMREAVGLTDEVLTFAKNISMHPETWLDFPWFDDADGDDDFEMSDAQKEHVCEVEHASPRLAALRIELCPDYMIESRFWKIYFVLLHSRLSKKDALLLSTPQIMEARALLRNNLRKKEFQGSEAKSGRHTEHEEREPASRTAHQSFKIVSLQSATEVPAKVFDQLENRGVHEGRPQTSAPVTTDVAEEKNVLANTVKLATLNVDDEEADADRWLHEETLPNISLPSAGVTLANEDDVSFSDLEEDDDSFPPKTGGSSSVKGSHGWVGLDKDQAEPEFGRQGIPSNSKLEGKRQILANKKAQNRPEPNDWLAVEEDDTDFA